MISKRTFLLFSFGVFLLLLGLVVPKPQEQKKIITNISPQTPTVTTAVGIRLPTIPYQKNEVLGKSSKHKVFVEKVIDGDTIAVAIDNKIETVRLIGIDTPETVDTRKSVQCFGKEASDFTKLLLFGKTVFLEEDETQGDRDRYQRLLRYVFLPDGTNANKFIIQQGYAYEYTYKTPYKYQSQFFQAQQDARENNRGLWEAC